MPIIDQELSGRFLTLVNSKACILKYLPLISQLNYTILTVTFEMLHCVETFENVVTLHHVVTSFYYN